jgi:DNA-directed RNA polymerase specialized sigma24 family protein
MNKTGNPETKLTEVLSRWKNIPSDLKRLIELAVARYGQLWIAIVLRRLPKERRRMADEEDVLQEIVTAVAIKYENTRPPFQNGTELNAFVCGIAAHMAISTFRRALKTEGPSILSPGNPNLAGSALDGIAHFRRGRDALDPDTIAIVKKAVEKTSLVVRQSLEQFSGPHRTIIELWLQGDKYPEMIKKTGKTLYTVRNTVDTIRFDSNVRQAVESLRSTLAELLQEAPAAIQDLDLALVGRFLVDRYPTE